MDLAPASFDEQLRWLVDNHAVITLDDALDRLGAGNGNDDRCRAGRAGRRAIVLTFDDGTTDWVDNVLPALEQHRAPATFYVATSFVEDQVTMPGGGRPISWAGLRELAGSELTTIGSHTHRHMLLDRLDRHTVAEELDRSVDLLGEHLGVHTEHFAYPKAVAGSPTAEGSGTAAVPFSGPGGHEAESGRHGSSQVAPLPDPGCRHHRVVPPQGARWDARRGRPAPPRQPRAVPKARLVTHPGTGETARRLRLVHVTTTDISLELLLGPQLEAFADAGYEVIGVSAPGEFVEAIRARGSTTCRFAMPHVRWIRART
ncbi:MAG: polysaccharide deacetylase family protein [Microthrixaceae bacterium]|nr:polysaccharide deacetylase family protein [Microthrixaceae bacterium]